MREMLFLIGGVGQGKRELGRTLWKSWFLREGTQEACREADGRTVSWEAFQQADIAWNLQEMVRRILFFETGNEVFGARKEESLEARAARLAEEIPDRIAGEGRQRILIADEVGCGIVPLKRGEREYRELAGRIACRAAEAAAAVWQVTAGIGRCIKTSDAGTVSPGQRDGDAFLGDGLEEIETQTRQAASEFLDAAGMKSGQLLVVGCSSSEIVRLRIGTGSSAPVGERVYRTLAKLCRERGLYLAAQCCEHLNRALILEEEAAIRFGYAPVNVVPQLKAGGSFATAAYHAMEHPVAAEEIRADGGIDIGDTLIGMHLKPVAVPVRISVRRIGGANVVCARVRPKFIGGKRARYDQTLL